MKYSCRCITSKKTIIYHAICQIQTVQWSIKVEKIIAVSPHSWKNIVVTPPIGRKMEISFHACDKANVAQINQQKEHVS